eukprot:15426376-Alexandrium_andersonii.AAC.1
MSSASSALVSTSVGVARPKASARDMMLKSGPSREALRSAYKVRAGGLSEINRQKSCIPYFASN